MQQLLTKTILEPSDHTGESNIEDLRIQNLIYEVNNLKVNVTILANQLDDEDETVQKLSSRVKDLEVANDTPDGTVSRTASSR